MEKPIINESVTIDVDLKGSEFVVVLPDNTVIHMTAAAFIDIVKGLGMC